MHPEAAAARSAPAHQDKLKVILMTVAEASSTETAWLTWLARRPAASLLVLCLFLWLPGALAMPPLDRDESRFAQASKQMIETGDFIDIRLGTGTRYNKPVGIYWLQAASAKILGDAAHDRIWTYRIPSLLGGYLAIWLLYRIGCSFSTRETAFTAAALLGMSVLATAETQIATTDAVLLAATLGAQLVLFRVYLSSRCETPQPLGRWFIRAGWFALAAGILLKGPVIVGVLCATAIAVSLWDRDWRWLKATRPFEGLAILVLVVLPWAVAIAVQSHGAFYRQSLGHDFAAKLAGGQESHGAPPGYYLALSTLTLWPAVLYVLPAVGVAWAGRQLHHIRFLLAWAGANWLMFEVVPTKLPHYILPAYPALALMAALWIFAIPSGRESRGRRILRMVAIVQFVVGALAVLAVTIVAPLRFGDGFIWSAVAIAAAGCTIAAVAAIAAYRGLQSRALLHAAASALVLIPTLTTGVGPRLEALWISPRVAALVARDRRPGDAPPVVAGYDEPSLIFLLGTNTRIASGAAAAMEAAETGGLAIVEDRERSAFLAGLAAQDTEAFPVDGLAGYDYSRGRAENLTIYRVAATAQSSPPSE